jgi:hypothetical protein
MQFPNLNNEPDPDDLAPEGRVTKQLWEIMYQRLYKRPLG